MTGEDWLQGLLVIRAEGFNKVKIYQFFYVYEEILNDHKEYGVQNFQKHAKMFAKKR